MGQTVGTFTVLSMEIGQTVDIFIVKHWKMRHTADISTKYRWRKRQTVDILQRIVEKLYRRKAITVYHLEVGQTVVDTFTVSFSKTGQLVGAFTVLYITEKWEDGRQMKSVYLENDTFIVYHWRMGQTIDTFTVIFKNISKE
jgi:hypothetical protein